MNVQLEITGLETNGESVTVKAQGYRKCDASWRPLSKWEFSVPDYLGKHYRIGKTINVEVT